VIEATDVRPVKEQVESLGAKFIDVPFETDEEREAAEGVGGYARPMPPRPGWSARPAEVAERVKQADIVITTALIPGRPRPVLVTEDMVKAMKPGSVIVDMAAEPGRQLPADRSRPGRGQARRDHRRPHQPAGPGAGRFARRCTPATCSTS
jgi:NAD(P) transhydrogenase subunit alpha